MDEDGDEDGDDELVKMLRKPDVKAEIEVRWLSVPTPYHVTVVSKHNERHLWTTFLQNQRHGAHTAVLTFRGIDRGFLALNHHSPVLAIVSGSTSADERRQAQGSLDRRLGAAWTRQPNPIVQDDVSLGQEERHG